MALKFFFHSEHSVRCDVVRETSNERPYGHYGDRVKSILIILSLLFLAIENYAQQMPKPEDFIKEGVCESSKTKKKTMYYVGKTDGTMKQLNIDLEQYEKIAVYCNDSLVYTDSLDRLDYSGFAFYIPIPISKPKRKNTVTIFLMTSKRYAIFHLKRKYYFLNVQYWSPSEKKWHKKGRGCWVLDYGNNAPSE